MTQQPLEIRHSGWVLGRLLDALQLRARFEQQVGIPTRTVQRYLQAEESAKADTRSAACAAFVEVVLPGPPHLSEEQQELAKAALADLLARWDEALGVVTGLAPPRWDHAHLPWLRLVLMDAGVRVAAYLLLTARSEPSANTWDEVAAGKGFAVVTQTMRRGKRKSYPRRQLARDTGVAASTLDEWLRGAQLPQSESLEQLGHALGRRAEVSPEWAVFELRWGCAATALVTVLRERLPDAVVEDLMRWFASFVAFGMKFMRQSRLKGDLRRTKLWQVVLGGSGDPGVSHLLNALSKVVWDQAFLADILAMSHGAWSERIIEWYRDGDLRDPEWAKAKLRDTPGFRDVPQEDIDQLIELATRTILVPQRIVERGPEDPPQTVLRISGDTAFKAANREQQWSWAMEAGRFAEAFEHARRLVELEGTNAKYHFWLGTSLGKLDQVDEAIAECRISATLDPTWCLPAAEVGVILLEHGRPHEAVAVLLEVARERQPRNPNEAAHVSYTLGVGLMRTQDFDGARNAFLSALGHRPDHALAMDLVAHCLLGTGQRAEGRRWAKRAAHRGQPGTLMRLEAGLYDGKR